MIKKTDFRNYLNKVGCYRNHWITAFNILKFDGLLSLENNHKRFRDWVYSLNWGDVKRELFLEGYDVDYYLKIKKLKGGIN